MSTITLPYRFDSGRVAKMLLKAALAVDSVIAAIGLLSLAVDPGSFSKLAGAALIMGLVAGLAILIFRKLKGAEGTITATSVVVKPSTMFGIPSGAPSGTFLLTGFKAVRVERGLAVASPGVQGGSGFFEIVFLAGKPGTPDIRIIATRDQQGVELGKALGQLVHLPVEEKMLYKSISLKS